MGGVFFIVFGNGRNERIFGVLRVAAGVAVGDSGSGGRADQAARVTRSRDGRCLVCVCFVGMIRHDIGDRRILCRTDQCPGARCAGDFKVDQFQIFDLAVIFTECSEKSRIAAVIDLDVGGSVVLPIVHDGIIRTDGIERIDRCRYRVVIAIVYRYIVGIILEVFSQRMDSLDKRIVIGIIVPVHITDLYGRADNCRRITFVLVCLFSVKS